jgi:hypothetical protein
VCAAPQVGQGVPTPEADSYFGRPQVAANVEGTVKYAEISMFRSAVTK